MKRMNKSVIATSIAAAALVSGAVKPVKADDLLPQPKKEEVQSQDVTLEHVQASAKKVTEAQSKVDHQKAVVAADEATQKVAQEEEKEAEEAVLSAQALVAESTPETIEAAQAEVLVAEVAVPEVAKEIVPAQEEKKQADSQVKTQETKVAQAEAAVTQAQLELAKVASAVAPEAKTLTQAQADEKAATEQVSLRQKELASAEQAAQAQAASQASQVQKIQQVEASLSQTQAEIVAKEAEIAQAKRASSNQSVLKDAAYTGFLATLGNQAAFQQALNTANQNGLTANQSTSPATIENALRAVEIMKEVNRYRRQAGLNELLVDPYKNVQSQIKIIGFNREGWHTRQFFSWENVAWGFDAKAGVDYWYNEKAIYQTYAAQLGLPTDEKQLDPGQLYNQLGRDRFSKVGHYLTMMGRDFNTMTAASSQIGKNYSEAGFHKADLNSGLYLTVADYEKALRNYISNANTQVNLAGLNSQLASLRNKKGQQVAELTNLKKNLTSTTDTLAEKKRVINTAKANLAVATTKLATAKTNVTKAERNYNQALARIEDSLKPQRAAVEAAKKKLQAEETELKTRLSKQTAAVEKLDQVQAKLAAAKKEVQTKKSRVSSLKNAKEILAQAQAALAASQETLVEKGKAVVHSKEELNLLLATLNSLQEDHQELLSRYRALHPEANTVAFFRANQVEPGEVETLNQMGSTYTDTAEPLVFTANEAGQTLPFSEFSQKKDAASVKMLPNTGNQASQLAATGMALGAAALLVGTIGRRKED